MSDMNVTHVLVTLSSVILVYCALADCSKFA